MAKIKIYRGISARSQKELDEYIKDFYDLKGTFTTHGGGANLGEGAYFTTLKEEAEAYSKNHKYSHVFELEVDEDDFLDLNSVGDEELSKYPFYKEAKDKLDKLRANPYYSYEKYDKLELDFLKQQDKALIQYAKDNGKHGVYQKSKSTYRKTGDIFVLHDKSFLEPKTESKPKTKQSESYWDKRALDRLNDAELKSEAHIKRVKSIYDKAFKDVEKEIEKVYKNYAKDTGLDVQQLKELLTKKETSKLWAELEAKGLDKYIKENYKARISRLEKIQAQIYARAKEIYPAEEIEHKMAYTGVINDSYYKAIYDTQMGLGYDFPFAVIDDNMVNALLTERWSGKNYSERIWGNTDILAESLSEVVSAGMISGKSLSKMSKEIRDRFNCNKYYAERLIRTEVNHFNNTADAMAYEEMGVDKYVFVATLDNRTSAICQHMDNKKFNYDDRQDGVNFPPLHPNCRSKTRGYLGEEAEKMLKRRARNPKTGKTELIDNIPYTEWGKEHGLVKAKPKVKPVKPKDEIKPVIKEPVKPAVKPMTLDDLPAQLRTSKEVKSSKIYIDAINNPKANPKVAEVYKSMGAKTKYDFTVSHGKKSSLNYYMSRYTGEPYDLKLTIPKLKDATDVGSLNTVLHENMHFMDLMNGTGYTFASEDKLLAVIKNTSADMSKDIQDIFTDFNKMCENNAIKVNNKFDPMYNELNDKISEKVISYDEYDKAWKKVGRERKAMIEENDAIQRSYKGGGITELQDIYDALSRGKYRDTNIVRYGHGSKYYRRERTLPREILANYGALSITRPDLVELLKADKPELVAALDELIESML